jgi:hypothetical protein
MGAILFALYATASTSQREGNAVGERVEAEGGDGFGEALLNVHPAGRRPG